MPFPLFGQLAAKCGPPQFQEDGKYGGPLPPQAETSGTQLIGKTATGTYATAASAAWPAKMCRELASPRRVSATGR